MLEIKCSICRDEAGHSGAYLHDGEWIVCEECFSSPTIRDVLICELEDAQAPVCWVCGSEFDHRHSSIHVGDWVVCLRCHRECTRGRLVGDHDDYTWLMGQDYEAESFARALREAQALTELRQGEEDENWLRRQRAVVETHAALFRALRASQERAHRKEDELWLARQIVELEFERGEWRRSGP